MGRDVCLANEYRRKRFTRKNPCFRAYGKSSVLPANFKRNEKRLCCSLRAAASFQFVEESEDFIIIIIFFFFNGITFSVNKTKIEQFLSMIARH